MNETKVPVCVTVLNRYDLLRELLLSLQGSTATPVVYIIDNGKNPASISEAYADVISNQDILVFEPAKSFGLAESWNWFISRTTEDGYDYRIISNDDITFSHDSLERMTAASGDILFPFGIGYSCFLLRNSCVDKIGLFDESLSPGFAYFEDCDYSFRIEFHNHYKNPSDLISMCDLHGLGITHLGSGSQRVARSESETLEFKRKYYLAQENFKKKWNRLPSDLRDMKGEECGSGSDKLNILFVGDSPTVSTGFSRCTRAACDALHESGHKVAVLGMGYYGDPHSFHYPIYPCVNPYDKAKSYGGEQRLPVMIGLLKPDLVVILQDPWNIPNYFSQIGLVKEECEKENIDFHIPPIVGWIAIDSQNQKSEQLSELHHTIVWTRFAENELRQSGFEGDISIVPLGVDTNLFKPYDKHDSRLEMLGDSIPIDSFIIGVVGRNQVRKRLDLTLEYFSEWVHTCNIPDAYLFLHVAPTGEGSCDLRSLIRYYNLQGKVILSEPQVGVGNDDSIMPKIYSCFDLLMTQSQAEGFHLPTLEALACGVPCLVPDAGALGAYGWPEDAVFRVTCTSHALVAPLNSRPYTVGSIPDKIETLDWLKMLYSDKLLRESKVQKGLELAARMTWKNTGNLMRETIDKVFVR